MLLGGCKNKFFRLVDETIEICRSDLQEKACQLSHKVRNLKSERKRLEGRTKESDSLVR